jgi:hypothetical protein
MVRLADDVVLSASAKRIKKLATIRTFRTFPKVSTATNGSIRVQVLVDP